MNEAERDALRFSSREGLRPLVCSRPAVAYRTDAVPAMSCLIHLSIYYLKGNIRRGGPERLAHMCYFRARGI